MTCHNGSVERRAEPPLSSASARSPNWRALLSALLSFVFPGIGQAYNGQSRLARLFAAPPLVVVGVAIVLVLVARSQVLSWLFDVRFLIGLIALDVALLTWRLVAIVQAHAHRERPSPRSPAAWATGVLVIATVAMHALPAYYAAKTIDTLNAVTLGGNLEEGIPQPSNSPGPLSTLLPQPSAAPDVGSGERVNILFVGVDSAPGRTSANTDTMLVVSLGPKGTRPAMISIPRDLYGVPLPDGQPYNHKLNSLMVYAAARPGEFPLGGVGTLKATIGRLLGGPIHYLVAINIFGFGAAVDVVGGVDLTVTRAINDPSLSYHLQPGTYHMDGQAALTFARSRKGAGDSDFTRADRQQQLLEALRAKLTAGNLLFTLPSLLDAVKNLIVSDVPSDRIGALALAVQEADISQLGRIVLQPPKYMTADPYSAAGYILIPNLDAIHAVGQSLLDTGLAGASPPP